MSLSQCRCRPLGMPPLVRADMQAIRLTSDPNLRSHAIRRHQTLVRNTKCPHRRRWKPFEIQRRIVRDRTQAVVGRQPGRQVMTPWITTSSPRLIGSESFGGESCADSLLTRRALKLAKWCWSCYEVVSCFCLCIREVRLIGVRADAPEISISGSMGAPPRP
jgi:hypothetical protein